MINSIEVIELIAAVLTTAAFVPQVYKTWKLKSAEGLSLTIYCFFYRTCTLAGLRYSNKQFVNYCS